MGRRRGGGALLSRAALIVTIATGMLVTGGMGLAHADLEQVDSGYGSGPQCLTDYSADGSAAVVAATEEIPYENVAGGPFTLATLTAEPSSRALASEDYEGFAGEVILATSGFYAGNPTTSNAAFPVPAGARSADQHDDGPFAHTTAYAEPRKASGDAQAMSFGMSEQGGGVSSAHSDSGFDGKVVSGSQVAIGYAITLGPLHIDWLRSEVHWISDGTPTGAQATWRLDFHGVRNAATPVYAFSGDGFSFQGGTAQPGATQRVQFNDQQRKFSEALDQAGIARADFQVQPGTVTVSATQMDVKGAGLIARLAPRPFRGQTTQAGSLQLGRVEQHVRTGLGPCDDSAAPAPYTQQAPPSGPNPPKFPPDKCNREGCHPQPFPPQPPSGPPPLPLPGGKQPVR